MTGVQTCALPISSPVAPPKRVLRLADDVEGRDEPDPLLIKRSAAPTRIFFTLVAIY